MADHPDRLRFFADVPDLSEVAFPDSADQADDQPPRSRVQIAKTGTFMHPVSGKATLTASTFDRIVQNFKAGIPNDRLPVDFDHTPDRGGPTRACGWIYDLSHDGTNLYADIEWTWAGAFSIRDGEYRYVSMAWTSAFVSDDQTRRGAVLVGLGLTNRPFLESMAPVSLSHTFARDELALAEEVEPEAGDGPIVGREMAEFTRIAKVFGLADDADETTIVAKATEIVTASTVSLEDRAKAEDKVVLSKTELAELKAAQTDAPQLQARIETLETDLATQRFETAFTAALNHTDGPKVTPAEKDDLRELFNLSEDVFAKQLDNRPAVANTAAHGGHAERDTAEPPEGTDADAFALDRKAQAYVREHPDVDYTTALDRVREES